MDLPRTDLKMILKSYLMNFIGHYFLKTRSSILFYLKNTMQLGLVGYSLVRIAAVDILTSENRFIKLKQANTNLRAIDS